MKRILLSLTFLILLLPGAAAVAGEDGGAVTASQAAWQGPGLSIRLEAVWYGDQSTCSAELFVRPTDIQPL